MLFFLLCEALITGFNLIELFNGLYLSTDKKLILNNTEKTVPKQKWSYILAAHPDDEVLCCGHVIQKILANGGNVKTVIFTNGSHHHRKSYGKKRQLESITALKKIGINKNDIVFLEFPDGNLHKLSNKKILELNENYTTKNLENLLEELCLGFPQKE